MTAILLNDPIFTDEAKARAYFEGQHWPNGPVCPHCRETERVYRLNGTSHRAGLLHCNACEGQFTVTTGTVMESSHLPLTKWALAFRLMASSKKGISAHQLHRSLGITYKAAWFMAHRIREAMTPAGDAGQLGGEGVILEADETEIGKSPKSRPRKEKNLKFMSLVERGGRVRSHRLTGAEGSVTKEIVKHVRDNMAPETVLHTDSANHYRRIYGWKRHETVNHQMEYVTTGHEGVKVHCNSAEGYFSIFKRGLVGTYQHMSSQHLHRYLAEFDFRMTYRLRLGIDDTMRTEQAIKGAVGKRLTYHQSH